MEDGRDKVTYNSIRIFKELNKEKTLVLTIYVAQLGTIKVVENEHKKSYDYSFVMSPRQRSAV